MTSTAIQYSGSPNTAWTSSRDVLYAPTPCPKADKSRALRAVVAAMQQRYPRRDSADCTVRRSLSGSGAVDAEPATPACRYAGRCRRRAVRLLNPRKDTARSYDCIRFSAARRADPLILVREVLRAFLA
jgi:hypothetical protein